MDHSSIETVVAKDLLYDDVYVNRQVTVKCDRHNVEKELGYEKFTYEEVYLYPPGADTTLNCPAGGPGKWDYDRNDFYCVVGQLFAITVVFVSMIEL